MTAIVVGVALVVVLGRCVLDVLARPLVRRIALRNATRRPKEAGLVVLGSALATALIGASLLVGGSFGESVRAQARTALGVVDEVVFLPDRMPVGSGAGAADDVIDAVAFVGYAEGAITAPDRPGELASEIVIVEADIEELGEFETAGGADESALAGIRGSGVVVNDRVAALIGLEAGDAADIQLPSGAQPVMIAIVVERGGVLGFADVIVPPGTLEPDAIASVALASNDGDWESGESRTDAALETLRDRFPEAERIEPVKRDVFLDAKEDSDDMTELFSTIGGFSVAAAILLIVNLFLMLIAGRLREIGTMQGLGMTRPLIRRTLAVESSVYALVAAVMGAALSVVVAWITIAAANATLPDDGDVTLSLHVDAGTVFRGAALGVLVAMATMAVVARRVSALNIAAALKNQEHHDSSPTAQRVAVIAMVVVALVAAAASVVFVDDAYVSVAAPVVALLALIVPADRLLRSELAGKVVAAAALLYCMTIFGTRPGLFTSPDLSIFLLQGVLMVALAGVALVNLADVLQWCAERIHATWPFAGVGLRYPLARPFRSNLIVVMFGLVIFTITFMSVMNAIFSNQAPRLAAEISGDFELIVDTDDQPIPSESLRSNPAVSLAVPVLQGYANYEIPDEDDSDFWWSTVVPSDFPVDGAPTLRTRSGEYPSDASVWESIVAGDDVVIAPTDAGIAVGETVQFTASGVIRPMTVVGTAEFDWALDTGFFVPESFVDMLEEPTSAALRHYVQVADGADSLEVASALRRQFVGAQAVVTVAEQLAAEDLDEQAAFLTLLQRYLMMGLAVGVTGLCAVLLRSIRDRETELATMIALGVRLGRLRQLFIVESMFLALQGVIVGVGLGLLSAWTVFTRSTALGPISEFAIPGTRLAIIALVVAIASAAVGYLPALQASRLHPAHALRSVD